MTPRGVAERAALTRQFLKRKLEEYERLQREIRELEGELDDATRS
jgi:molybdenum-dependent DNA-binding transcriptional regulator ModE